MGPLLRGADADWARSALERIIRACPEPCGLTDRVDLAQGQAGLALFFAHLHRWRPEPVYRTRALGHLRSAEAGLSAQTLGPGLYDGFAGIAWCRLQVHAALAEAEAEDPFQEIDSVLLDHLRGHPASLHQDLVFGLAGLGVYGLARARHWGRTELLEAVVAEVLWRARAAAEGMTWITPAAHLPAWQASLYPEGLHNLGLAHGIPGLLGLLGQAGGLDIGGTGLRICFREGCRWLFDRARPGSGDPFPAKWLPLTGAPHPEAMVEATQHWCYGTLGLGLGVLAGARHCDEPVIAARALTLCRQVARQSLESRALEDPSLCHGSAGTGHLFHRLYRCSGEPGFRVAALRQFRATRASQRPGREGSGFPVMELDQVAGGVRPGPEEHGFLRGHAGIGLVLLAALTGLEPAWDAALMADIAPWEA